MPTKDLPMVLPRPGFDHTKGKLYPDNGELVAEMLAALIQCREYLKYSFGSASDINPYPAMDAAIEKARGRS